MRTRLWLVTMLLVLAWGTGGSLALAQDDSASFTVAFKFFATGKVHPAGTYQVRLNEDRMGFTLAPAHGARTDVPVVTRLAEPEKPIEGARVVFDKVGEVYYLSEVWLPGEDGFLLHTTKGPHTHERAIIEKK